MRREHLGGVGATRSAGKVQGGVGDSEFVSSDGFKVNAEFVAGGGHGGGRDKVGVQGGVVFIELPNVQGMKAVHAIDRLDRAPTPARPRREARPP